jgi:hypothetical protein
MEDTLNVYRSSGWTCFPILFNLYVNDMPTTSLHVEPALYADGMALAAHRCSSVTWSHISADVSTVCTLWTGDLLSTSQTAPLCSSLKLLDASKGPVQSMLLESQYSEWKQHGILGWPLIHG